MMVRVCPYCNSPMVPTKRGPSVVRRMTRDHIFPTQWGGTSEADNIRMCCQQCNSLRAAVGHCIGAMACVQHVAKVQRQDASSIARRWRMYAIASLIRVPT